MPKEKVVLDYQRPLPAADGIKMGVVDYAVGILAIVMGSGIVMAYFILWYLAIDRGFFNFIAWAMASCFGLAGCFFVYAGIRIIRGKIGLDRVEGNR